MKISDLQKKYYDNMGGRVQMFLKIGAINNFFIISSQ